MKARLLFIFIFSCPSLPRRLRRRNMGVLVPDVHGEGRSEKAGNSRDKQSSQHEIHRPHNVHFTEH